jgi:serine protease AprX
MIAAVVFTVMLLTSSIMIPIAPDTPEYGSEFEESNQETYDYTPRNLLSPDLERKLAMEGGLSAEYDVIIQFHDKPTLDMKNALKSLNFGLRHEFRVLNGVSGTAKGYDLVRISESGAVAHIEINYPMQKDMEMSLSVINATKAWDSQILRFNQSVGNIDGTGVTVCVVDTGIDASHPDMDYGTKTIFNLHDIGGGNFVEIENSDLNYGHGTHVAGTVAGNGDASAGARSGVAPGANLIGLSVSIPEQMSDPSMETYISGLEWVYENSKPGNNPYNIRCATNSWHATEGEYDPDMALTVITEMITFENNVLTTWSAGNDGRDDPEGTYITTSQQGNTPCAIVVAAYERDGSAVTDFSSRGQVGWNHTYPDVGGPGRRIWSCAARRTLISGLSYTGGDTNPYYLAISGTSMSTPHIAGAVALLWQAAPSMKISYIHEDYSGEDPEGWYANDLTRVHEVELILEASATYLEPTEEHGVLVGNESTLPGWNGAPTDYVQGYGIINMQKAVGIALALEELRTRYPEENITVFDAIENYERITEKRTVQVDTDVLETHWAGEYSRFHGTLGEALSMVNQTKKVYIPEGASTVKATLTYAAVDREDLKAVDLAITVDYGDDGSVDFTGGLSGLGSGVKEYELDASANAGDVWTFDLVGQGIKIQNPLDEQNYVELRAEYDITLNVIFQEDANANHTRHSPIYSEFTPGEPSQSYSGSSINKTLYVYDLSKVRYTPPGEGEEEDEGMDFPLGFCLLGAAVIVLILIAVVAIRKKMKNK